MLIKKIELENIRSYVKQEIEFPEDSTLLSGDIGSGKTSVLLSIDFALFGLRRGNLSGASLLRNGANSGKVKLHFTIDDKDIVIERRLKRGVSVTQDSGYIIINNEKREATALELKQFILDLLQYPQDMLTRSKDLIYKYTVYTPQDEMKYILLSDNNTRLETLRKVFGVDKYKLIKDNVKIFIGNLKESKKEILGYISDLNEKIIERDNLNVKIKSFDDEIKKIDPLIQDILKKIEEKNNEIKNIEDEIKKLNEVKLEIKLNEQNLKNNLEKIEDNKERTKRLEEDIEGVNKDIKVDLNIKEIDDKIKTLRESINEKEDKFSANNSKINSIKIRQETSNKLIEDISDLNVCPVCKQNVNEDYKNNILEREDQSVKELKSKKEELEKEYENLRLLLEKEKNELEEQKKLEREFEINKIKLDNVTNKLEETEKLKEEQIRLKNNIGEINVRNGFLYKDLNKFEDIDEDYTKKRKDFDRLKEEQKMFEVNKSNLEVEKNSINKNLENLNLEIKKKEQKRLRLEEISNLQDFLEKYFIDSLDTIENNVMLKIYTDFNALFEKWFNILVDDEDIKVRLMEDFSPMIEQNNHDIDYVFLSGGEKTAAALAYRLALNHVINNLITTIKTNDLIILDEPTDGFSDEQLDRIRLVLNELKVKQVIIVSHEPKIESFVDNVIRFKKENHISYVI
tara:strand:+ start:29695 stop:31749 length:2055 start_codon:yes stop_codon:yes gene_type:complete